jgi:DNA-nicking Smr family endonuclease
VNELVPAYLQACQEQGITQVRIIHGKGSGALRRTVRSLLDRHPQVVDYRQDDLAGSWGATIVTLRRPPS